MHGQQKDHLPGFGNESASKTWTRIFNIDQACTLVTQDLAIRIKYHSKKIKLYFFCSWMCGLKFKPLHVPIGRINHPMACCLCLLLSHTCKSQLCYGFSNYPATTRKSFFAVKKYMLITHTTASVLSLFVLIFEVKIWISEFDILCSFVHCIQIVKLYSTVLSALYWVKNPCSAGFESLLCPLLAV